MRCRCPLSRTVIVLLALAGCGGGSDGGDHAAPTLTATPSVATPAATATPSLAAGALDPAFGGTGLAIVDRQRMVRVARHGLRVLANGDTEVLVIEGDVPATTAHLLRVSPAGATLAYDDFASVAPDDAAFGANGDVWMIDLVDDVRSLTRFPRATSLGGEMHTPLALAGARLVPLANGGVLAVGGTATTAALERFRSDGSVDTGFGTDGVVLDRRRGGDVQNAYATAAVASDGRIFVVGTQFEGLRFSPIVLAYDETGAVDGSFGRGGIVVFPSIGNGGAIVVMPDGGLVVATTDGLVRLTSAGTADPRPPLPDVAGLAFALPNGELVAASNTLVPDEPRRLDCSSSSGGVCQRLALTVSRVAADGTLDERFGATGTVVTDTPPPYGAQDTGYSSIVAAPAGRLTTAGILCRAPFVCDVVVARYVDVGD